MDQNLARTGLRLGQLGQAGGVPKSLTAMARMAASFQPAVSGAPIPLFAAEHTEPLPPAPTGSSLMQAMLRLSGKGGTDE